MAKLNYKFTKSDSEEKYKEIIEKIKKITGCSIAQWELEVYETRR
jgi:hypothetical protein